MTNAYLLLRCWRDPSMVWGDKCVPLNAQEVSFVLYLVNLEALRNARFTVAAAQLNRARANPTLRIRGTEILWVFADAFFQARLCRSMMTRQIAKLHAKIRFHVKCCESPLGRNIRQEHFATISDAHLDHRGISNEIRDLNVQHGIDMRSRERKMPADSPKRDIFVSQPFMYSC